MAVRRSERRRALQCIREAPGGSALFVENDKEVSFVSAGYSAVELERNVVSHSHESVVSSVRMRPRYRMRRKAPLGGCSSDQSGFRDQISMRRSSVNTGLQGEAQDVSS